MTRFPRGFPVPEEQQEEEDTIPEVDWNLIATFDKYTADEDEDKEDEDYDVADREDDDDDDDLAASAAEKVEST